eukprot:TRINITY_DN14972_c0_g1_i1.p1 TRINITY_DN14972_c0_g1~~TRINITY_DN14972_c0_g1_i1.p1  ORF type:complete len:462 (-),score=80.57 TRINITY_DN14972_c0_g1_i1:239-1624(-)
MSVPTAGQLLLPQCATAPAGLEPLAAATASVSTASYPVAMCRRAVAAASAGNTSAVGKGFLDRGWAVIDGLLGNEWASSLAADCEALESHNLLIRHSFAFTAEDGSRRTFQHDGRSYVDLEPWRITPAVASRAPSLASFAATHAPELAQALAKALPALGITTANECTDDEGVCKDHGENTLQVKLQLTLGEHGCAPCHYDTSDSAPSRQVTLLLYLSSEWNDKLGGELRLLPFLEAPVDIVPAFDRGVIFLSDRVLHRSLPPSAEGRSKARWLLTVWLGGSRVDRSLELVGSGSNRWPPLLQRLLTPAVYADAYLAALEESLPDGEVQRALRKAQLEEIYSIEADEALAEMLGDLREAADAAIAGAEGQQFANMSEDVHVKGSAGTTRRTTKKDEKRVLCDEERKNQDMEGGNKVKEQRERLSSDAAETVVLASAPTGTNATSCTDDGRATHIGGKRQRCL